MGIGGPVAAALPFMASLFSGGGAAAAPAAAGGNPWDAIMMPEKNPAFHDAPNPGAKAPMANVIAGANNPNLTPYDLAKRAGQTTQTVQASEVPLGSAPPKPNPMPLAAPGPLSNGPDRSGPMSVMPKPPSVAPSLTGPVQAATNEAQPAPEEPKGLFGKLLPDSIRGPIGTLQDKLGDAAGNPLFQVGMGLLASGYDGSNPWTNIQKSLGGIQPYQIAGMEADIKAQQQQQEQKLQALLAQLGLKYGQPAAAANAGPQSRQAAGAASLIR